jgi:uncharacterized protein (UPF0332 family)
VPVGPRDFEAIALTHLQGGSEIHLRNAASRIYYAAFHQVSEVVTSTPSLDHFVQQGGTHRRLVERFLATQPGSITRRIGTCLQYMLALRAKADYAIETSFADTEAKAAFGAYRNLQPLVAQLRAP